MPPKTKRQRQRETVMEKARDSKRSRVTDARLSAGRAEEPDLVQLATMSEDALDTEDEAVDPSFDLDSS